MTIDAPNEPVLLQGMMSQTRLMRHTRVQRRPCNDAVFDRQPGPRCPGGEPKPELPR